MVLLRFYVFMFVLIPIVACKQNSATEKNKNTLEQEIIKNTIVKDNKNINDELNVTVSSNIEGVWSENLEDNALFLIENDTLYYTENIDIPVPITHIEDTFILHGRIDVKCKILKLTNNEFWYIDELSDDTTKLIKVE